MGKGGFVHQDVLRLRFEQPQLLSWSWQCFQQGCAHMSVCMVKQLYRESRSSVSLILNMSSDP